MKAAWIITGFAVLIIFAMFIYSCLIIAARDVDDFELYNKGVDSDEVETDGVS